MSTRTVNRQVVIGSFASRTDAERAVAELRRVGFASADLGVAAKRDSSDWSSYDLKGDEHTDTLGNDELSDEANDAATGAATGAAAGAGVGGLWALGIAAGLLPAIGPVVAGGVLGSLLASAAAGAATGGILGSLIGLGIPEDEARYYEGEFQGGRTLVTVRTDGRAEEAMNIIRMHGGT